MKKLLFGWGVVGFVGLIGIAASQAAYAMPLGTAADGTLEERLQRSSFVNSFASSLPVEADAVDFTAIVALSNCSASLVRFENSLPDDHAVVMTNGHCNDGGFILPGQVLIDLPSARTMKLLSSDGKSVLASLKADRILFGTMTKTDMILYRLTATYADLETRYAVRALTFQARHPEAGRAITIASGYWRKLYSCKIDRFIPTLKEDNWTWIDSLRYSKGGCETIHGTSGSPIIDSETHEVVGINNTGNDDGGKCTMDNPCEVDSSGNITVEKGVSYGQQTYWVYGCLGAQNQFDLTRSGCELPH